MLEAFLVTLRESAELMLIVGALRVYLRHAKRTELDIRVLQGTGFGIFMGLALAVAMVKAPIDPRLQALVTIAFALSVLVVACGMFSSAQVMRGHIHLMLERWIESAGAPFAVAALASLLALREALEVALFVHPLGLNLDQGSALHGVLLGLAVAGLLGMAYRGIAHRIDLMLAFRLSAIVLSLLAIQLLLSGIGELLQAQALVSRNPALAGTLAPFLEGGEWYRYVCAMLMTVPILALARGWWNEAGTTR